MHWCSHNAFSVYESLHADHTPLQTVAEQAKTIAKLEAEKRWLIQELFQCRARGCHTSTHDTSSVDSLLLQLFVCVWLVQVTPNEISS